MSKESFVMMDDWYDLMEDLDYEQRGQLISGIYEFELLGETNINGYDPEIRPILKYIIKQIDKNNQKYHERIEKLAEAGRKGGQAKARNGEANASEAKQMLANASEAKQMLANAKQELANASEAKHTETETVSVSETETESVTETETETENETEAVSLNTARHNKRARARKSDPPEPVIDEAPEELRECLEAFVTMRKTIKAPVTGYGLRKLIKQARDIAGGDMDMTIRIFDQSTNRSWRGVFPLKGETARSGTTGREMTRNEAEINRQYAMMDEWAEGSATNDKI